MSALLRCGSTYRCLGRGMVVSLGNLVSGANPNLALPVGFIYRISTDMQCVAGIASVSSSHHNSAPENCSNKLVVLFVFYYLFLCMCVYFEVLNVIG